MIFQLCFTERCKLGMVRDLHNVRTTSNRNETERGIKFLAPFLSNTSQGCKPRTAPSTARVPQRQDGAHEMGRLSLQAKHASQQPPHTPARVPQRQDGAHEMGRLSLQAKDASQQPPHTPAWFPVPSPGRSVTQARRLLRKQPSKLPCKRPQTRGSSQGLFTPSMAPATLGPPWPADVSCRHCAKEGAFGGNPAPQIKSLHG